jgi:hypothetical protein
VILVAVKAYYLHEGAADPPSDASSFLLSLTAISYADVVYAAGLGSIHRAALAIGRPRCLAFPLHALCCFTIS